MTKEPTQLVAVDENPDLSKDSSPSLVPLPEPNSGRPPTRLSWWKRGLSSTKLAAFITAMVPLTTFIVSAYQKSREEQNHATEIQIQQENHKSEQALKKLELDHTIKMEEVKLNHGIQTEFLDRTKPDTDRLRTLRFVAATNDDPKMVRWASYEMSVVSAETNALKKQIDDEESQIEKSLRNGKMKATVIAQQQELKSLRLMLKDRLDPGPPRHLAYPLGYPLCSEADVGERCFQPPSNGAHGYLMTRGETNSAPHQEHAP